MYKKFWSVILLLFFFVLSVSAFASSYVYNTLSDKDKALYDKINNAVLACAESIDATGYTKEDCLRIYVDYLADHPNIFWADNGIRCVTDVDGNNNVFLSIYFKYTHQQNLKKDKITFVNTVDLFHEYIKDVDSDWQKLFEIYDYLASSIKYDNNYTDQSMWSVFFNCVGVCAGFAKSFQYLALCEDIPCIIVSGYERDENGQAGTVPHVWCMAQLEGRWYHFDPTWGVKDSNGNVDYTYFCRSQERIEKTHVIDNQYPIPEAKDDSLSYVKIKGRYLENYSLLAVQEIAKAVFGLGEDIFTLEFSTQNELIKAIDGLIVKDGISTIIGNLGMNYKSYSYKPNYNGCALTLSFAR